MLHEIKDHLQKRRLISLAELSVYFDIDAFALEGILDVWVQKGKVRRLDNSPCEGICGGCTITCQRERWIFYSWNTNISLSPANPTLA